MTNPIPTVSKEFIAGWLAAQAAVESVLSDPAWENQISMGAGATIDQALTEGLMSHGWYPTNKETDA